MPEEKKGLFNLFILLLFFVMDHPGQYDGTILKNIMNLLTIFINTQYR